MRHRLALATVVLLWIVGANCHPRTTPVPTAGGDIQAVLIGDPSPRGSHYPSGAVRDGVGGRIMSLAMAGDGRRVYAATLRAGVWRSDDGGAHWRQLGRPQPGDGPQVCPPGVASPCGLPGPFIADVAVAPNNPDLVFAAVALDTSDAERDGVYRSSDGGETWQLVHQFSCALWPWRQHPPVGQVMFAPDDPTKLWAAGGCTIAYSAVSGSPGDVASAGVTRDQIGVASTWHDGSAPSTSAVWHVAVSRSAGQGARAVYACGPGQLWISTDGGQSFTADPGASNVACDAPSLQAGGQAGASVMVVDPSNAGRVFLVASGRGNGPVYFDSRDCGGGTTSCRNPDGNRTTTPTTHPTAAPTGASRTSIAVTVRASTATRCRRATSSTSGVARAWWCGPATTRGSHRPPPTPTGRRGS